ncbi:MAG: diguanylate cyclase [Myxococcales bacterium]|nr:diguanylate cyclase [Myxococcota bacterium]MDW8281362.1 diguanylate cyclase [Myxococcales bacterium]
MDASRSGTTILIIDDTRSTREELTGYLTAIGHRTITAETGLEGLRLLREHRPDLVLLDVVMPSIDGFKIAQMMKSDMRAFIPIILMTARTDFETRRRGHKAGADDFITKPVNPDELAIRIDAMLRIKSLTEQLEAANARLAEMADTDGLTGVANRRRLDHMLDLEHERSRRYKRPLALLVIDIDHFKRINDTYGHAAGDAVLKTVAAGIREMLRRSDVCGRYGGEEFVVIAPELTAEGAVVLAERIRKHVAAMHIPAPGGQGDEPKIIRVTVSIGVASFDQGADAPIADLMHRADTALYQAKNQGRDRVIVAAGLPVLPPMVSPSIQRSETPPPGS